VDHDHNSPGPEGRHAVSPDSSGRDHTSPTPSARRRKLAAALVAGAVLTGGGLIATTGASAEQNRGADKSSTSRSDHDCPRKAPGSNADLNV
jgi:hypothetical protein